MIRQFSHVSVLRKITSFCVSSKASICGRRCYGSLEEVQIQPGSSGHFHESLLSSPPGFLNFLDPLCTVEQMLWLGTVIKCFTSLFVLRQEFCMSQATLELDIYILALKFLSLLPPKF